MIAHVAESGEDRGRVVLQLRSGTPSTIALEAAIRIARAFGSEIESLFIEDQQLFDCAQYGFVQEVSLTGRQRRAMSADVVRRDLHLAARGARRQLETLARRADIPLRSRVVRDEPLRALSIACAEKGPWNVVALAEPLNAGNGRMLRQVLQEIAGTTGIVIVGPKGKRLSGSIVIAVEDTRQLPDMLHAAERLAGLEKTPIVLLLIATDAHLLAQMDGEARLVIEDREDVRIEPTTVSRGATAEIAEALRRLRGGFVIGQFGGLVVPDEGDLRPLLAALECPLLLVR